MKAKIALIFLLLLTGCTAVQDPWHWMEKPELQEWRKVKIGGYPRVVTFSFPDRRQLGGQSARISGAYERTGDDFDVRISTDELLWPYIRFFNVTWDWYWGGFYKEDEYDVHLSVSTYHLEYNADLLALTPKQLIDFRLESHHESFDDLSNFWSAHFWENFWIKEYENPNGVVFVVENSPNVTADHQDFSIPVSPTHRLKFSFFVSDKRMGREEDPEWNKSRWDLAYKIMDTVEVFPDSSTHP